MMPDQPGMPVTDVDDAALLAALRRRMLSEIESPKDIERIVNNIYGGGVGGMMGQAYQEEPPSRDDYEYMVDILRKDLPEKDPETGKPIGWEKSVRRYKKKVTKD